jgi:hypothetical protein
MNLTDRLRCADYVDRMETPPLPSIEQAVENTVSKILGSSATKVTVSGAFGAGKTTVTALVESELRKAHLPVLRVKFPTGDDAACAVVADVCDAAKIKPELSLKVSLERALATLDSGTCLILDEPRPPTAEPSIFNEHLQQCVAVLLAWASDKSTVVSQRLGATPLLLKSTTIHVARSAEPDKIIADAGFPDSPLLSKLLHQRADELRRSSPLEVRLAAQLAVTDSRDVLREPLSLVRLMELVALRLSTSLRRALARLSLLREPLSENWLDWASDGLNLEDARQLRSVFLFGESGALRLHESIAHQAANWMPEVEREAAHREIAQRYVVAFSTAANAFVLEKTVRAEMECIHHRTAGADAKLLDDSLFFVEQYDVLGRAFGLRGHRLWDTDRLQARDSLKLAVRAYDRALTHEPDDWYALHYRAFNCDVLGGDVCVIGPDYERVTTTLKPDFVWGHSRYIRWLITCGRLREARSAFAIAEQELSAGPQDDVSLYRDLHVDVARQALENGHHALAREFISRVPRQVRDRLLRYAPLRDWADYQSEIEAGETVFPPFVPHEQRWLRSHLAASGESVAAWMPGVVTAQEGELWRFRVAFSHEQFGWREVTREELVALNFDPAIKPLEVGRFVEFIGTTNGERLDAWPPLIDDPFRQQRVTFPDPRRYLTNDAG